MTEAHVTSHVAGCVKRSAPSVPVPGSAELSPGGLATAASPCTCTVPPLSAWSVAAAASRLRVTRVALAAGCSPRDRNSA